MKRSVIVLSLFVLCQSAWSQDDSGEQFKFFPCDAQAGPESQYFKGLEAEAMRVDLEFCRMMNSQPTFSPDVFESYGLFLERTAAGLDFGSAELDADVVAATAIMSEALGGRLGGRLRAPNFVVDAADFGETNPNGGEFTFRISTIDENRFMPSAAQEEDCAAAFTARSCLEVFEDLGAAANRYKKSYTALVAGNAAEQLAAKSDEWDRFFDEARTPGFLDLLLTSMIEGDRIRKGWPQGPPKRQYFMLRPNVILQYHDGAPQGDQFTPGISLEWIGINWWDKSPLGIPFGVSVTSVYADVPEVDRTVGTGLTFHFRNNLTIGWARHGSENSFHVSADLLQFLKDKQARFDDYKSRFDALVD